MPLWHRKRHGSKPCLLNNRENLLFLIFVLGRFHATVMGSLGLGLFHGLLGFGGFFGANFGALFLFLVENLLAAEQFQESLVGAITLVPTVRMMRVYPPLRSPKRGPTVSNSLTTASSVIR